MFNETFLANLGGPGEFEKSNITWRHFSLFILMTDLKRRNKSNVLLDQVRLLVKIHQVKMKMNGKQSLFFKTS
jgi:hypothetical protein